MINNMDDQQIQSLYQYCFALTHNTDEAFDLLQTGLEKWLSANKNQSKGEGYLRRIIRNQFIDDKRHHNLIAFEPIDEFTPVMVTVESIEQLMINEQHIESLMQHLNAAEREVLFLSAVLEYSATEIAKELSQPRGTILSKLFRIKKKLCTLITDVDNLPIREINK